MPFAFAACIAGILPTLARSENRAVALTVWHLHGLRSTLCRRNELGTKVAFEKQLRANRRIRRQRRGITETGRQKLREACLRNQPWLKSTGPMTLEGKLRSRQNAWKNGEYCLTIEPEAPAVSLAWSSSLQRSAPAA